MKDEFLRLLRDDSEVQAAVRVIIHPPDPDRLTLAQRMNLYAEQHREEIDRAFDAFWERAFESPNDDDRRPDANDEMDRGGQSR